MAPSEEYLVFIPDSSTPPQFAYHAYGVEKAMDELGPAARVKRITTGEMARFVTQDFRPERDDEDEPGEVEPAEVEPAETFDRRRAHLRMMRRMGAFGR